MDNHNSRSNIQTIAEELLGLVYDEMDEGERRVLEGIAKRHAISRDLADSWTTEATFGQRIADRVAAFGGSWTFIILFFALIAGWVLINTAFILRDRRSSCCRKAAWPRKAARPPQTTTR